MKVYLFYCYLLIRYKQKIKSIRALTLMFDFVLKRRFSITVIFVKVQNFDKDVRIKIAQCNETL
jgi:hypothetical protein